MWELRATYLTIVFYERGFRVYGFVKSKPCRDSIEALDAAQDVSQATESPSVGNKRYRGGR